MAGSQVSGVNYGVREGSVKETKNSRNGAYFGGLTMIIFFACVKVEMPVNHLDREVNSIVGFMTL
jgi:hypothetical protein